MKRFDPRWPLLGATLLAATLSPAASFAQAQGNTQPAAAGSFAQRVASSCFDDRGARRPNVAECEALTHGPGPLPAGAQTASTDPNRVQGLAGAGVETIALTAVADFVVARAGQEAQLLLREQIADDICAHFRPVFPKTCEVLTNDRVLPYGMFGLGSALQEDLLALPGTVFVHVFRQLPVNARARPFYCIAAASGVALIPDAQASLEGANLSRFAAYLRRLDEVVEYRSPAAAGTATLDPAEALRAGTQSLMGECNTVLASGPDAQPWVQFKAAVHYARGVTERVESFAQENRAVDLSVSDNLAIVLNAALYEARGNSSVVPPRYQPLEAALGEFVTAYLAVRAHPGDRQTSVNLAHAAVKVVKQVGLVAVPSTNPATAACGAFLDGIDALIDARYGNAAVRMMRGLEVLLSTMQEPSPENRDEYQLWTTFQRFGRVFGLLGAMAGAETTEQAVATLNAAAVPLGTWRAHHQAFSGFLGAELGVMGGGEFNLEAGIPGSGGFLAPTLPVGLSMGGPLGRKGDVSWRLMIGLLDLGSLVSVRVSNVASTSTTSTANSADGAQPITLERAFAPSVWWGTSFCRTPVRWFVGVQYAPVARDYIACSGGGCATESQHSLRMMAGVSIDVPILRLW